ncbi:hypothetical protein BLNAU_4314 [Blattamonas nauphoetae]|uniref:Uncharacterized protein n=1 Tax=Blattamonas nauphoetae TaxID=2049346 RepID=A0ABQ9YAC7_9EUKA|nr:hypothetical protein BLNAU_4314 [Blattamonas nauphoetae]
MLHRLQHDKAKMDQILKQIDEKNQQMQRERAEREEKHRQIQRETEKIEQKTEKIRQETAQLRQEREERIKQQKRETAETEERTRQLNERIQQRQQKTAEIQQETEKIQQETAKLRQERKERIQQQQREESERAENRNTDINTCIKVSLSHSATLIKSILRNCSPNWITRLARSNASFSLLADGHILFSKNMLKDDQHILSAPLLFRPVYNAILCPLLKLITHHFGTKQHPSHPGALFYISGDHGVGKTSLMLILMSALSDLSIEFFLQIVDKYSKDDEFEILIRTDGQVKLSSIYGDFSPRSDIYIHIYDDRYPRFFQPNHLYLIFTSPDQKRLQPPELKPGQLCYTFRLPTFSLAEDTVVMVGCTPTVPFALLSPEDMELRKEEQLILLSIEKDQVESAGKVPFEMKDIPITSQQESAKTLLKSIAKYRGDFLFGLNAFLFNIMKHLVTRTEHNPNNRCMTLFLNDVVQMHTVSDATAENDTPTSKPHRLNWETAIQTLRDNIQPIDDGLGNVTTPNFSEMTNTSESIETLIKWHVGRQTDIDPFSMSLCRTILESRNLPAEKERISVIVNWLINQLDANFERDKELPSFLAYLLRELVLSGWNDPQTPNKSSRKLSSKRRRSLKLNTSKTTSLLNLAMTSEPPHFTIQSDIVRFSALVGKANLTGPPTTSATSESKDSLTSRIARMKKHFKEPDIREVARSRRLREEAKEIEKDQKLKCKGQKKSSDRHFNSQSGHSSFVRFHPSHSAITLRSLGVSLSIRHPSQK